MASGVNASCTGPRCVSGSPELESNASESENLALLKRLNDNTARLYIPIILYIVILLVLGVIGNSLVLYVYLKRFKRTSSNYFIMSMAMFDMVACCVGMPTEIYDLRYPYMFFSAAGCKIFRFTESVTITGSALILVAVAFDRYFKICRPLKNTQLRTIKRVCIAIAVFAFFSTTPTFFVFGLKDVLTDYSGVVGKDCSVAKKESGSSVLPKIWFSYLMMVFVASVIIMCGLYIRIWMEIKRRQKQVIGDHIATKFNNGESGAPRSPTSPTFKEQIPLKTLENPPPSQTRVKYLPSVSISSDHDSDGMRHSKVPPRIGTLGRLGSQSSDGMEAEKKSLRQISENVITKIKASKTTVILFSVTLAFILSYLPTLTVTIINSARKDGQKISESTDLALKFLSKSYFINNSINPIIYSFLNVNFRMECAKALTKLAVMCTCCLPWKSSAEQDFANKD